MSKTWFAVGPDGGEDGWFAYQAENKFDAIWLYYEEHGAPKAGSERINADLVPEWQGLETITPEDGFLAGYELFELIIPAGSDLAARMEVEGCSP